MLVKFERIPVVRPAWSDVEAFEKDIDSLFGGLLSAVPGRKQVPAMDLIERPDETLVALELPGVAKEDITVSLEDDLLTVKAERKSAGVPDGGRWIRSERIAGNVMRTVQLSHPVKAEGVTAELVNGVLKIALPKADEARPREISIK